MPFIRFERDQGIAQIWLETAAEDGWLVKYCETEKLFHFWHSGECEALGHDPHEKRESLNGILELIEGWS